MENQQIAELLKELALKFGTTVEHLWEIMIRQAIIEGIIDIMIMSSWVIILYISFTFVRNKTTELTDEYSSYSDKETATWIWVGFWCMTAFIIFIISMCLGGTLSAIMNPEYWALKQILPK